MKKLLCILASAALLGACEQKTDVVAPAASPADKKETNTTIVNPPAATDKSSSSSSTSTSTSTTSASPSP